MLPVTSSTSNSDSPWAFLLRCAAFLAFWIVLCQPLRLVWGPYPEITPPTRSGDELRLIRDDAHYDHLLMLTDKGALAEAARADVVFAGNSRVQYGIDFGVVKSQFDAVGLRPYWLAFPYEERAHFVRDVMLAGDLRPKLLVLHIDAMTFDRDYSRYWEHFRAIGLERAKFEDFKTQTRNRCWRLFMRVVPLQQLEFRSYWMKWLRVPTIYRSMQYGDWVVTYPPFLRHRARLFPPADQGRRLSEEELLRAHSFVEFCRARGTEVVFMTVPNSTSSEGLTHQLGGRLKVRVLPTNWEGMHTFDYSHLVPDSARRNTRGMLQSLRDTPEWRDAFDAPRKSDF